MFPDYAALIVRNRPYGRELAMARWGMPSPLFALQQAALRTMRELRAEGVSLRGISQCLAAEGHRVSHMTVIRTSPIVIAGRSNHNQGWSAIAPRPPNPHHPTPPAPLESNVIDLMAALKKSLGGPLPAAQPAATAPTRTKATKRAEVKEEAARKQPGLKLPLQGGKKAAAKVEPQPVEAPAPARGRRKAS